MGRWLVLSIVVLACAVFLGLRFRVIREIQLADRQLKQNHLPNCQPLNDIEFGSEDIAILEDGLAIISTGLKFELLPVTLNSDRPGKMYIFNMLDPDMTPVSLQIEGEFDQESFNPHGISTFTDKKDGSVYLFVVNHPNFGSQVEIFQLIEEKNTIVHLKTIKHNLLHDLNDIVAVGVDSFYATNTRYYHNQIMHLLTIIFGLAWSDVVYYSPDVVKVAATGFSSANGINISPDYRYLYVSDIIDHDIDVLEIQKGGLVVPVKSVHVNTLCDNIDVHTKTGDLFMGCHPNAAKLAAADPNDPAGSEVIRIQDILSDQPIVSQVYEDDGSVIIGSTIAARYEDKLLIGTAYHRALRCDLS